MSQQNEININYLHRLALQELENDAVQEINSDLYNSISKLLKNLKNDKHDGIEGKINQATIAMITDVTSTLLKLRLEKATLGNSKKPILLDEEKYILDSRAEMEERRETILSGILKGEPHSLGTQ